MGSVTFLGTGAALAGADRENSYLLVRGSQTTIMIDCAGAPAQRMAHVGMKLDAVDYLILTHHHPDHMYGYPLFVLNAWLQGRKRALHVIGLEATLRAAETMLTASESEDWPHLFPIEYIPVNPKSIDLILTTSDFTVSATLGQHFVPTIATRITERKTEHTMTYTSDTSPHDAIVELARDSDVLIHEATAKDGTSAGHSTAVQAGMQARLARAKQLIMIHVPPECDPKAWRAAAKKEFKGPVHVARDFEQVKF